MKTTTYPLVALALAGIAMLGVLTLQVMRASANPSQVVRNNPSTATTTVTYMTAGTATTTNTFNTQADGGANADSSAFTVCLNASTTATVLNVNFEYSFDNVTWMQNNFGALSTSTGITSIVTPVSYSWAFASTTIGGQNQNALNNSACKIVSIPTPIQYVRAVLSLTGAAGSVWSDFGAKREQR